MRARKLRTAAKRRRKAFNHPTPKMLERGAQLDRKRRKDRGGDENFRRDDGDEGSNRSGPG